MLTLIGIVMFLLSIAAHELGHAFAMKKYGYQMTEICLCGIGNIIFQFKINKIFGDTPITIRMFPFVGFVRYSEITALRMKLANWKSYTHIKGGGVIANFLFSAILYTIVMIMVGNYSTWNLILISLLFLIGLFPRVTTHLVLPIGIFLLYSILHTLFNMQPHQVAETGKSVGSVVTIAADIHKSISVIDMIMRVSLISISIGILNALPLIPLDGGHLATFYMEKLFPKHRSMVAEIYGWVTFIPLAILILFCLKNDLMLIVNYICKLF